MSHSIPIIIQTPSPKDKFVEMLAGGSFGACLGAGDSWKEIRTKDPDTSTFNPSNKSTPRHSLEPEPPEKESHFILNSSLNEFVMEGLQYTNQVSIGGVAGFATGYFIRNFGKMVLTAVGGGVLFMVLATKKGYVEINWKKILIEAQKRSEQMQENQSLSEPLVGDPSLSAIIDFPSSPPSELTRVKQWVSEHSLVACGFVLGVLYNIF